MKRISIDLLEKSKTEYLIKLSSSANIESFESMTLMKEYIEKSLEEYYENDYSYGLKDVFIKIVEMRLEETQEELPENRYLKDIYLNELRYAWDRYHIDMEI